MSDDKWMQIVYGRMNELAARGVHADLVIPLADPNIQATLDAFSGEAYPDADPCGAAPMRSGGGPPVH